MIRPPWAWLRKPLALPTPLDRAHDSGPPCVVHLVRAVNGLDSLRGFAAAYRRHPPGIEAELVLAMKGFNSRAEVAPYLAEVADLAPTTLFFPDAGLDKGVFFATAARLRRARFCFLHSHVRPLEGGWLAKLATALDRPDAGVVGSFGSWASFHSWLTYAMGLPSYYRRVLPPLPVARQLMTAIDLEQLRVERRTPLEALRARLELLARAPEELLTFEPFPDHHLRTSAFMIRYSTLRQMRLFTVRTKMDTYVLESGPQSITRQVERMGLRALVVDRAGTVYGHEDWHRSATFWQGHQERLLIADNRTRSYEVGDAARRSLLSSLAWGTLAAPSPPSP